MPEHEWPCEHADGGAGRCEDSDCPASRTSDATHDSDAASLRSLAEDAERHARRTADQKLVADWHTEWAATYRAGADALDALSVIRSLIALPSDVPAEAVVKRVRELVNGGARARE